jgi:hypothetical protein
MTGLSADGQSCEFRGSRSSFEWQDSLPLPNAPCSLPWQVCIRLRTGLFLLRRSPSRDSVSFPYLIPEGAGRSLKQLSALRDVTCRISHVRSMTTLSHSSVVRVSSLAHSFVTAELDRSACCLLRVQHDSEQNQAVCFCLACSATDTFSTLLSSLPLPSTIQGSDSWNVGDVLAPVAYSWAPFLPCANRQTLRPYFPTTRLVTCPIH